MRYRNVSVPPNQLLRKVKRRHFPDNFVWFTLNLGIIKEMICFVGNSPDKVLTSNRCRPGDITRIIDWLTQGGVVLDVQGLQVFVNSERIISWMEHVSGRCLIKLEWFVIKALIFVVYNPCDWLNSLEISFGFAPFSLNPMNMRHNLIERQKLLTQNKWNQ